MPTTLRRLVALLAAHSPLRRSRDRSIPLSNDSERVPAFRPGDLQVALPTWSDYVKEWIRHPVLLVVQRMNIWTTVEGVRLGVLLRSTVADDYCMQRIRDAMALVRLHMPTRYDRIRKNVCSILVAGGRREDRVLATYSNRLKMCLIEESYLLDADTSLVRLGGTLVHEATHAYLYSVGVRHTRRTLARIEQICAREEIRFYQTAGGADDRIVQATEILNQWRNIDGS